MLWILRWSEPDDWEATDGIKREVALNPYYVWDERYRWRNIVWTSNACRLAKLTREITHALVNNDILRAIYAVCISIPIRLHYLRTIRWMDICEVCSQPSWAERVELRACRSWVLCPAARTLAISSSQDEKRGFVVWCNQERLQLAISFWAGVIFSNTVIIIVFFGVARVGGTFENLSLLAPAIIPLVAGVPLWMISRATLSRNLSIEWDRMANKRVDILPNSDLLLPFVYTSANIMVLPIMYKFLESINSLMLYYGWFLAIFCSINFRL